MSVSLWLLFVSPSLAFSFGVLHFMLMKWAHVLTSCVQSALLPSLPKVYSPAVASSCVCTALCVCLAVCRCAHASAVHNSCIWVCLVKDSCLVPGDNFRSQADSQPGRRPEAWWLGLYSAMTSPARWTLDQLDMDFKPFILLWSLNCIFKVFI